MRVSAATRAITVNGIPVDGSAASILAATRSTQSVTRLQARLALGQDACAILDAAAINPEIPWSMREAIKSATVWHRTEPEIDELAWLLNLTPDAIDNLFARAMAL